MLELIIQTSTNLPPDVRKVMGEALRNEKPGTQPQQALAVIAANIDQAQEDVGAICQDTGMPTFFIHTPVGVNQVEMKKQILEAVAEATKRGKLRPNSVDSLTGKNSGNNLGPGTPVLHWEQWEENEIEAKLVLKGGGCENVNAQYSLPCELPVSNGKSLGRADRNLEGVRKCILHAVWQAQGQGCSPGALGVCIGGDRTASFAHAKEQLLRTLDDTNPNPELAALERWVMEHVNSLGIGPMGFGGATTLIGCKIGMQNRLPASFFVSIAYDCWAFRRLGVRLEAQSGAITGWLYRDPSRPAEKMAAAAAAGGFQLSGREVVLETPLSEEKVRALKLGDLVLIRGRIFTGRDAVHGYLIKHEPPVDLRGAALYHCGPVMVKEGEQWVTKAAGPTTSIREEPYQHEVIRRYGVRAIIGKGGMGAKTLAALEEHGAVYLHAIGGAAQVYARTIKKVPAVHLLEFGIPEAMWEMEVYDFPALVTMDAHGHSLHAEVERASAAELEKLAALQM
jgi:fumarate hydratase class I